MAAYPTRELVSGRCGQQLYFAVQSTSLVASCWQQWKSQRRSARTGSRDSNPPKSNGLHRRHVHRRPPPRALLPAAVPGPHQPNVPARRPPPRARPGRHRVPHRLQRARPVPPPRRLRIRTGPRGRRRRLRRRHDAGDAGAHPRHERRVRGAVPGAPGRAAGALPGGGSVPGRRRAPADADGRCARARRADDGAAHRQRRLLPLLPGLPHALRQGLPAGSRVAARRAGDRAAAVPRPGPAIHQQRRPRRHPRTDHPDNVRDSVLVGPHPQHPRRARGRRAGVAPARPRRAGVQRRPAPQALAAGGNDIDKQQPAAAGPRVPNLARRAGAGVRALRQLRQPRQRVRRRPRGNGLGHRRQRPPLPLGAPARPRPRRITIPATAAPRRVRRRDARPGRRCELGAAGGGPGAPGRGGVLDALRLELDDGGRVRRRAHALPPLLRRPDGQRALRRSRLAGRRRAPRRAREGQGAGRHRDADGRHRAAAEREGAQEQSGRVRGYGQHERR